MTTPKKGPRKRGAGDSTPVQNCRQDQGGHENDRSYLASLANMRNELRMPVNAIIEYSEMLLEDAIREDLPLLPRLFG
jgi:hypothetical protein